LQKVGLSDKADLYPFQLSGGQQQRIGIARALAIEPSLLLFDDPTSALDPELVQDVLETMKQLASEGWTMVVVTHEINFARDVADHVVLIEDGKIVEEGSAEQMFELSTHPRTQAFLQRIES
ncbi:MAG TPA: ATP-binding cassette domain-containing protein, partial [Psychrobacter sp.]|uniref:ATP-binding cassette domain-containing protein n=1 Tax=Psychrobacter sp. TaxID=56811 RepID=UPI002B85A666